ncbi:MAG TPA: hypothetical protein VD905_08100, partial [Flavobacteriales bacterium]|nr:hypothetical protein [Flavobacteriales bacterium]
MSQNEKKWQIAEKLAATFERFLTSDSVVQHNIKLPVLGKPNRRPRQCDVVITFGKAPTTTIAIVEVQKRKSKPRLTTFHGWIKKMREVGAQQLICVSEAGFPSSIVEEVKYSYGKTIALMTLKEFDHLTNPEIVTMLPYQIIMDKTFKFLEIKFTEFDPKPLGGILKINTEDAIFKVRDNDKKFSLNDIAQALLYSKSKIPQFAINELKNEINILEHEITENDFLSLIYDSQEYKVKNGHLKLELTT